MKFAKKTFAVLLAIVPFLFAGCTTSSPTTSTENIMQNDDQAYVSELDNTYDYELNDYLCDYDSGNYISYCEIFYIETTQLSLGDTFLFRDFEVTIGDRIEFVLYDQEYEHKQYLYVPITVTIVDEKHPYIFEVQEAMWEIQELSWQLMGARHYKPNENYPNRTIWHSPGYEEIASSIFLWGDPIVSVKTHVRLLYSSDGEHTLKFSLREDGFHSEVIKIFELLLDIVWPSDYTTITIEQIQSYPGEPFRIGSFRVVVNSDFTAYFSEDYSRGIHLFPAEFTNIGLATEYFSYLELARLSSNAGFPVPIHQLYFEGAYVPLSELPSLSPNMRRDFQIPIYAFVCENSAWYRSFRLTERVADSANNHITVRHHNFDIYVVRGGLE